MVGATCVPSSVPYNFGEMPQVVAALLDGEPAAGTPAAAEGALRQVGSLAVEPQGRSVQSVSQATMLPLFKGYPLLLPKGFP